MKRRKHTVQSMVVRTIHDGLSRVPIINLPPSPPLRFASVGSIPSISQHHPLSTSHPCGEFTEVPFQKEASGHL